MMAGQLPPKANTPPEIPIKGGTIWKAGDDPAARLPYTRHKFQLPKIVAEGRTFVWPVGTETFSRSGSATLGIHKYLGRGYVDVHQIHRDEARIEMEGMFPGLTASANMRDLIEVLAAPGSKQLYVPGVFTSIQTVYSENYDFRHTEDDRTHSISYRVSFVRTTTQGKVDAKQVVLSSSFAEIPSTPKAQIGASPDRTILASDSLSTLRAIADYVYKDAGKWPVLVTLNKDLDVWNSEIQESVPPFMLAVQKLNIGTRIRY